MRVKRNIPAPIKSFHIKGRELDNNDFNIHLFSDIVNGKKVFSFIISKDNKEENTVIDKQNIISMIHVNDQNDVKPLINKFGAAIKSIYGLERPIHDYDLIDSIEKNIGDIEHDMWKNKNATKYLTPAQKIELAKKPKYEKSTIYGEEDQDIRATKPIIMIETLEKMGLIRVAKTEPNGDETKYKFTLNNSNVDFNISVVRHHGLTGPKAELFKDFHNGHKAGLGGGGLGILTHLGEYGLFGDLPDGETNDMKISRAKEFYKEQVRPNVKDEDMVYTKNNSVSRLYLGKSITFQPVKKPNKRTDTLLSDFLEFRGISKKVISKCFEEDIAFSGDFYVSRIQKELKEDQSGMKPNYGYNNAPYFRLRKQGNGFFGAERFQIKRTNNKSKPFEYDKKNTGSVDGKYFAFGEQKSPKLAIVHEAIIDALSSYELLDEAGADADAVRYLSTQGASHMKKFFIKNMGFWTDVKNDLKPEERENRTKAVYINTNSKDISEELKEEYINQLKKKKIIFIDCGDTSKTMLSQLDILKDLLDGRLEIIKKDKRDDVNFKDYDVNSTLLVDKVNFTDFLLEMKLNFEYDTKERKSILKTFYTRDNEVKLDDRKKITIKNKIERFFGTKNVAFGLDNDHAGLPYVILFAEMKRHFDINVSFMIPDDLKYENFEGTTLKTMMKKFEDLCEKDKHEDAYDLIHKYIKQKPAVDNNDVWKNYQSLKNSKPEEAKKILQYKLEQLKIDSGSDLFPKKKVKRSQRP